MFYRSKEAGKSISKENAKKIQAIHNTVMDLGASCTALDMYESSRTMEAALPMTTSHDSLRGHLRAALKTAHPSSDPYMSGPWIMDVFPEHVVYQHENQTYRRKYTSTQGAAGTDPTITLGDAKKVHVAYVDTKDSAKEAMRLSISAPANLDEDWDAYTLIREKKTVSLTPEGDEVAVQEGIVLEMAKESAASPLPKAIPVKLIAPGWGSSAYYSKEVLKRDGPNVFKAGTQMFWNHATDEEELQRPEGDLNDLAAVLTESAHWDDNGAKGPGLYAKAKVFSDYATQVADKGPHIGLSINAYLKGHEGEAEGKTGLIADKFIRASSVDFVTKPGAGGAPIVPAKESQRGNGLGKETSMTDQEAKELKDAKEAQAKAEAEKRTLEAENAKLKGAQFKSEAVATISEALNRNDIPFSAKILERLCESPVVKEGKLDQEWCKSVAKELAEAAGQAYGVEGLGERHQEAGRKTDDEKLDAELKAEFEGLMHLEGKGLEAALKGGR